MSAHLEAILSTLLPPHKVVENVLAKNKSKFSSLTLNGRIFNPVDIDTKLDDSATAEQVEAFNAMKANPEKIIAIIGPGGTGKSQFIHWITQKYKSSGRTVHVTATTGYAAYQLNGTTFYKFFSLSPGWYKYATKLESDPTVLNEAQFAKLVASYHTLRMKETALRIINTDLLVIDEVSMLEGATLMVMDMIARYLRRRPDIPFGGMQVLLSGDFLQLPPVTSDSRAEGSSRFIFQYFAWDEIWKPIVIHFTTNVRSQDPAWSAILARMRLGKCTDDDIDKLKRRCVGNISRTGIGRLPPKAVLTHLYPLVKLVENFNEKERNILTTKDRFFMMSVEMHANVAEKVDEEFFSVKQKHHPDDFADTPRRIMSLDDPAYELYFSVANKGSDMSTIPNERFPFLASNDERSMDVIHSFFNEYKVENRSKFRVGEKVMLRENLMQEEGLVNGSTGIVVGFLKDPINYYEKSTIKTIEDLKCREWSEDAKGLPVVQWSHGETTFVPYTVRKIRLAKTLVTQEVAASSTSSSSSRKRGRDEEKRISWMMHFYYLPLQAASAITSHKCQGLTLPYVYVGTPKYCFDFGMVYVMCSRVRKLEHLFLDDSFDMEHIRAHPDAVLFAEKSLDKA